MESSKENQNSWVNLEGDENMREKQELNEEKIKIAIKKRLKKLKSNTKETQENTEETIENMVQYLNELQTTEEELYELLKDENDSSDKNDIINKINDLSSKRDGLYNDMKNLSKGINSQNQNISSDYKNQLQIVEIAENQLNKEKERLKILNAEKFNKLRMVEINTYYSKRYQALGFVTMIVIFFFLIALLVTYLSNINIIPSALANSINPILIGIALSILAYAYYDILKRSDFDFDQYTWMKPSGSSGDGGGEIGIWPEPDLGLCVGETCCSEGTTYDSTSDTCKVSITTKEGFINEPGSNKNIVTAYQENYNNFSLN